MMKKFIITLTLLFLVFFCFSQGVLVRTTGTQTVEDMRLMAGLNFYVPVYPDTTTANLTANKGIDSAGALIFCRDINGFRIRRSNPKRWDYVTDSAVFSTITALKDSAAVLRTLITSSTVGAGGNNTDIQFNKSGAFAGNDSLQYDGTNLLVGFNKNVALKKGDYLYFNGVDTTWKIQLITTSGSDHIITGKELRLTIPTTSEGFSINNGAGVPSFQVQGNSGLAYIKGSLQIGSYQLPNTDGVNGQALITNGTGNAAWTTIPATGITALTGDVTASGTGSVATTLATVNSSPNTFGDSTQTLIVTVNAKGLVTSVVSKSILISQSQILNPNITGLIAGGTNIALSGSGTSGSPYVINSTAPGTGTVTSITAGAALTGGTITTSGTIGADTSVLATKTALIDSLANYVKAPVPNSSLQHSAVFLVPSNGITVGSSGTLTLGNTVAIGLDTTKVPTSLALADTAAAIRSAIGSGGITSLTGDVTASGTGSVAATLATVNSNVGSFTNTNLTVNAKGLITAASNGSAGNLTGDVTSVGLATTYNNIVPVAKGGTGTATPSTVAGIDITVAGSFPNQTINADTTTGNTKLATQGFVSRTYQPLLTLPLSIANGGTGTASPSLVAGTNVTITGSFPNQTINASSGGTDTTIIAGSGITQSLSGKLKTLKVDTALIATKSYVNQQDTIINAGAYLTQTYSAGIKSINADTTNARLATQTQLATKQNTLVNGNGTTVGTNTVNIGGTQTANYSILGNNLLRGHYRQNIVQGDTLAVVGNVFADNFNRGSLGGNYSTAGSAMTITFPGTGMKIDSGKLDGSNYIQRLPSHGYQQFVISEIFQPTTMNTADSSVASYGIHDTSIYQTGYSVGVSGTPTNKGKIILKAYNGTVIAMSTALASYSINDRTYLSTNRIDNAFVFTLKDLTIGGSDSTILSWTISTATSAANFQSPATGYTAQIALSGHPLIDSFWETTNEPKYVPCIMGNSIAGGGYDATYINGSWPYLLFGYRTRFEKIGGNGDRSVDVINNLTDMDSSHPTIAVWDVTTNDVSDSGVSEPMSLFVSRVKAFGANCVANNIIAAFVECTPNPNRNSQPYSDSMRAYVAANPATSVMLGNGLFNRLKNGTSFTWNPIYTTVDSLHPNPAGHVIEDSFVAVSFPTALYNRYYEQNNSFPVDSTSANYQNGAVVWKDLYGYSNLGPRINSFQVIGNPVRIGAVQAVLSGGVIPDLSIYSTGANGFESGLTFISSGTAKLQGNIWQNSAGGLVYDAMYWGSGSTAANTFLYRLLISGVQERHRDFNGVDQLIIDATAGIGFGGVTAPKSNEDFGKSIGFVTAAKTASYTMTANDICVNFTANNDTLTLPTAIGCLGRTYTITNSGTGWVKTFTTSSQTFINLKGTPTTIVMDNGGSVSSGNIEIVMSNGANWIVISRPSSIATVTLSSGTITVSTPAALTNSTITLQDITTGALTNVGSQTVGTVTNGVSFVINSTNVLDASNVTYTITP